MTYKIIMSHIISMYGKVVGGICSNKVEMQPMLIKKCKNIIKFFKKLTFTPLKFKIKCSIILSMW
jgi:hypothetical protein